MGLWESACGEWEVCWGVGGGEGSCVKRYGGLGGGAGKCFGVWG